jgi:hypothetical protein
VLILRVEPAYIDGQEAGQRAEAHLLFTAELEQHLRGFHGDLAAQARFIAEQAWR